MSDIGFTITKIGNFPTETYEFAPIQSIFNPIKTYYFECANFYCRQPYSWLSKLNSSTYNTPTDATINYSRSFDGGEITYISNGKVTFEALLAKKSLDSGYAVNYFSLVSQEKLNGDVLAYAYLFYPDQLVLTPSAVSKNNNTSYSITLVASILENKFIFLKDVLPLDDENAPLLHTNYIASDNKTIAAYPTNVNNACSFLYSISSTKSVSRENVIVYSQSNQPKNYSEIIENNSYFKKIRNDRTFFEIGAKFYITGTVPVQEGSYSLKHPDNIPSPKPLSKPLIFNNVSNNTQSFAFLQSGIDINTLLGASSNCILSATLDLNSTQLNYYSRNGLIGSEDFKISYIVDSANFLNNETVQNTVISYKINNTVTPLTSAIPSTKAGHNTVTYVTKYPPHFYSYKISLVAPPSITDPIDEYCSSFSLTSVAYRETTTSVLISTYLRDEFGKINLDLETYGYYDKIKYQPDFLFDPTLLDDITAKVGTNASRPTTYDLKNPAWVNAVDNPVLEITFPANRESYTDLSIRPMLINDFSGINAAQRVSIIPIQGVYKSPPYALTIKQIKEGNDYIDLSIEALSSITSFPYIDLSNSKIQWKLSNPGSYIKLNYLKKNSSGEYEPIDFIQPNTTLNYDEKSWAIRLSGYGPITTQIMLSSQKYNVTTSLSTDPQFFDFYNEKKLIIEPSINLDNESEIRTITLSAYVPFRGRIYNLPQDGVIYWGWTYGGVYNDTVPVTAKYVKNGTGYYEPFTSDTAANIDKLQFLIKPNASETAGNNIVLIRAYTADTIRPYTATYTLNLDAFPSKTKYNADFYITYTAFPSVKILDTKKGEFVLTRRNDANAVYTLTVNPDIISTLTNKTLTWTITNAAGTATTGTGNTYNFTATNSWRYYVNLKISGATVPGWSKTHTVEQNATIYSLDTSVFDKKLKFITYPEYTWKNSDQATILNSSNYTLATSPTAYAYKTSKTESFWVSSDGIFDRFVYAEGPTKKILKDSENYIYNDNLKQITIDYNNRLSSSVGTTIYLSAYNEYYPYNTPLYYSSKEGSVLVTRNYNITAESIPYSPSTPSNSRFFQNPKIVDYNGITHTFSAIITSFNLDFSRNIYVKQKFNTNPLNTPAKILTDSSTVVYTLSTPKWFSKKEVPAIDGTYMVFTIKPGDDMSPLRVSDVNNNTLYLNASSNLNIKIPESTFDTVNVGNLGLRIGGDLWDANRININNRSNWETLVAYTTSTQPEIFLNTFYALPGSTLFVEFKTPEYTTNPIVSYAVNFGGTTNQIKAKGEKFFNTFTDTGTYYVSYSAIYQNNTKKTFIEKIPFVIKKDWPHYNEESVRIISETVLEMPYSLNDIHIQPNEFGDSDIFNTALTRIDQNLTYLKNNIQTMNSFAPSHYYGWMGSNTDNRSGGIRWYTQSYGSEFYDYPSYTANTGSSYFTNIKDIFFGKYIYVLDDTKFRLFENDKNCKEVKFLSAVDMTDLFFDPKSIAVNSDESTIYVADSIINKIYRFDLDFSDITNPIFSLVLTVGTLGSLNDTAKFDFPSELCFNDDYVYVLDYNNNCVKQYSSDLSWIHTYYDDILKDDQILNMIVHVTGLLYVITKNLKVHIFDTLSETVYSTFDTSTIGSSEVVKMAFDESGEFLYIVTKLNVFKYTSLGEFVTTFNLPDITGLEFTSGKSSTNREINISTKTSILRFQDFVQLYKIGDGLESKYWSMDQILLKKEEFATDVNYNLALNRTAQNIKTFRNSLNGKFVLVAEQTSRGTATYFSLLPISKDDVAVFENDIEQEKLRIGTNEFHVPTVINRELSKLYNSQLKLKENLDVSSSSNNSSSTTGNSNSNCSGEFCWSWKAMSCYELTLPLIRLCNINPITYEELLNTFPVNYAPSRLWQSATSDCCNEYASPLV